MSQDRSQPCITVGITCYNAENTIERAVTSAFSQTWPNLDVIIVDDCSTDSSRAVIHNLIQDRPGGILVCHETNQGPAGTRNTILKHARGEFVAFFDDDDESLPERISLQYRRIIEYENSIGTQLIACYASGHRLYPNGYRLDLKAIGSKLIVPHGPGVANYLLFYGKNPEWFYGAGTPTCALMARRSTFESQGNFDPDFRRVEDVDFAIRLGLAGGHFIGCPENLFIQYATEATDKAPRKNLEAELKLAEKYKDYLISVGRYEYAKIWPRIRFYHFNRQHGRMFLEISRLFVRHPFTVLRHLWSTGIRRLVHEFKMNDSRKEMTK